jgi:hypothetical protein
VPIISTEIPAAMQMKRKRKNEIFFSSCDHTSKTKESSKLNGVATRKNPLSKNNNPISPML